MNNRAAGKDAFAKGVADQNPTSRSHDIKTGDSVSLSQGMVPQVCVAGSSVLRVEKPLKKRHQEVVCRYWGLKKPQLFTWKSHHEIGHTHMIAK